MTPDKTPSDSEIEELARPFIRKVGGHWENDDAIPDNGSIEDFARAVLAKWGSPVVVGPVAPFPGMNEPWPEEKKRELQKVLAEMFGGHNTPQPTQAPAGAVPLTPFIPAQRERLFYNRPENVGKGLSMADWHRIVQYIESAHGINGETK